MSHIVLTDDQARLLDSTTGPVEARDSGGRLRAILQPLLPQEVEALTRIRQRRASADPTPTIPAERVQAMLRKFHEIESTGELTAERMREVLRRVRSGGGAVSPYTVDWTEEAAEELAEIWSTATDRPAVTKADAQIAQRLTQAPYIHGYHVSEGMYRIDVLPLSFAYEVDDVNHHVLVTWVWYVT